MRLEYAKMTPEIESFFDFIFSAYKDRGMNYEDVKGWRRYSTNRLVDHKETFPMKGSSLIFTRTSGEWDLIGYVNDGYWHNLTNSVGLHKPAEYKTACLSGFDYLVSELQLEELPMLIVDSVFGCTDKKAYPFYISNQYYHFQLLLVDET